MAAQLRQSGPFRFHEASNRHADGDSDRQPDAHITGNHAEDSSERGSECDP